MPVRSYTDYDAEKHTKRKPVNRSSKKQVPEDTNSKTQRRKRNLPTHQASQFRK